MAHMLLGPKLFYRVSEAVIICKDSMIAYCDFSVLQGECGLPDPSREFGVRVDIVVNAAAPRLRLAFINHHSPAHHLHSLTRSTRPTLVHSLLIHSKYKHFLCPKATVQFILNLCPKFAQEFLPLLVPSTTTLTTPPQIRSTTPISPK